MMLADRELGQIVYYTSVTADNSRGNLKIQKEYTGKSSEKEDIAFHFIIPLL